MLQESGFARQTRRPICSPEAAQPGQRVFAPLPVIFISQSLQPRPLGKKPVRHDPEH
jgi:hypothetical protein